MTPPPPARKDLWPVKWLLIAISTICVIAGAMIAYWIVHEKMGYYGNKSTVFYIGGGVAGYMLSEPLWWLYRRKYPKEEQSNGRNGH